MQVNIGLSNTEQICAMLAKILADEHVLSIKTHGAHWNVEGPDFAAAHAFFGGQYDDINGFIDEVAERIRQLGVKAPASMTEYVSKSEITEAIKGDTSRVFYMALALDHETVIRYMRIAIEKIDAWGDCGTANFLQDLMTRHEKMAWMLRSHVS